MSDADAPDLPGYDRIRALGHGGFADVFLYRQHLPSREVAVKVLRSPARSVEDRARFENETNRMAMLSSHPGIVTIYEVGVAPDGRPFLTMEFCPHDHFGAIVRQHPLTVTRALDVGIKVAAAVETAHRAAILHRDIKPANILLTAYGEPALTDFGIAGGGDDERDASQGLSIPFAAPEVLRGATTGDARSDVYSLGATVYALLAGRSPFSTGTPMGDAELVQQILHAPLPPTGRLDLPPTMERVLALALAREPANRYESAAAFGRALQGVEAELGLAQTPLRIAEAPPVAPIRRHEADDDSTRFRSIPRIDPDGPTDRATDPRTDPRTDQRPTGPTEPVPGRTPAPAHLGLGDRTVLRGGDAPPPPPEVAPPPAPVDRRRLLLAGLGVLVLLVVAVLVVRQIGGDAGQAASTDTTVPSTSPLVLGGSLARPQEVVVEATDGGGQVVTWTSPAEEEGDTYQVTFTDGPSELRQDPVTVQERELQVASDRRVCVVVEAIRGGRVSDPSTEVCTR